MYKNNIRYILLQIYNKDITHMLGQTMDIICSEDVHLGCIN